MLAAGGRNTENTGPTEVSVSTRHLRPFEPTGLGSFYPLFVHVVSRFANRRQSEILDILRREATTHGEGPSVEAIAYRLTLSVLADYVSFGNYPVVADGRCFLVNVLDTDSLPEDRRRALTQRLFQGARNQALADRNQIRWLETTVQALADRPRPTAAAVESLAFAPPDLRLLEARSSSKTLDDRGLWRAVRATWSMGVESSAPGREVAFVGVDSRHPSVPLGIVQFRNVVPEIVARDRWLGITGSFGSDGSPVGYLRYLTDPDGTDRLLGTQRVLRNLLSQVNSEGLDGMPSEDDDPARLIGLAASSRRRFDDARRATDDDAKSHLAIVKRAETAADLIRGARAIGLMLKSDAPLADLSRSPDLLRDLNAGLRKIWHYHMGFVALEMSICGAAPPFGPLRVGKLMATTAGSHEVIAAWGSDRPLGEIASQTYLSTVRDVVPNPGPLVVFTSGVYPGHSAQYNRLRVGQRRWTKIGDTVGYGSFHVSVATSRLAAAYNGAIDGYRHITRAFGEGSSARFRQVGRAISRLELPDLLRHEIARPLYVLPLVPDPQGVLLGWSSPPNAVGCKLEDLSSQWWGRWVAPQSADLVRRALAGGDLTKQLSDILRAVRESTDSDG